MFICSMRAGTIRFFAIICVALAALITLIALVPELQPVAAAGTEVPAENTETVNYEKIRSNEDRITFLAQFGWQVEETPKESANVAIPAEFDKVFAAYNELQRRFHSPRQRSGRSPFPRCPPKRRRHRLPGLPAWRCRWDFVPPGKS